MRIGNLCRSAGIAERRAATTDNIHQQGRLSKREQPGKIRERIESLGMAAAAGRRAWAHQLQTASPSGDAGQGSAAC
jgi:hypothetical protein